MHRLLLVDHTSNISNPKMVVGSKSTCEARDVAAIRRNQWKLSVSHVAKIQFCCSARILVRFLRLQGWMVPP